MAGPVRVIIRLGEITALIRVVLLIIIGPRNISLNAYPELPEICDFYPALFNTIFYIRICLMSIIALHLTSAGQ